MFNAATVSIYIKFFISVYMVRWTFHWMFNSSPHIAAYMRQWIVSAFVRVIACHLSGTKLLPAPMLTYCQ